MKPIQEGCHYWLDKTLVVCTRLHGGGRMSTVATRSPGEPVQWHRVAVERLRVAEISPFVRMALESTEAWRAAGADGLSRAEQAERAGKAAEAWTRLAGLWGDRADYFPRTGDLTAWRKYTHERANAAEQARLARLAAEDAAEDLARTRREQASASA